ncbi:MAG TPA: hypothetical protein VG650_03175 [Mycobacteriales bacterium]|nr:hypothetical protein [Mycobacteriales bacterium]
MSDPHDIARQLETVEATLSARFGELVSRDQVHRAVEAAATGFADARVRTFVPVLVQRQVSDRLRREMQPV